MKSYTYQFKTNQSPTKVFELVSDISQWWVGIYEEKILGHSKTPGDAFTFSAGGGKHFLKQELIEIIPNKKISWIVRESNLSFLENPKEWENTWITFELFAMGHDTQIIFTHIGLSKDLACYTSCSNAWSQYLNNLENKLNRRGAHN
ncbi:MAG TPA: SRPBCC domain-containing protein [Saprospiraceae bacterium]|nr:SRPBCC domain-containing protein [Saprospiraceae bacterium]